MHHENTLRPCPRAREAREAALYWVNDDVNGGDQVHVQVHVKGHVNVDVNVNFNG